METSISKKMPWELYDELIAGIPAGIEVRDLGQGPNWTYVEAACGCGISHRVRGGALDATVEQPLDLDLHSLAALAKSWNFEEASLGIAALNAWYATEGKVLELGGEIDWEGAGKASNPFHAMSSELAGRQVAVVGHFPNVTALSKIAHVTVLERNCSSAMDVPDSACEYIIPTTDYLLMTGTTITNKTAPRLLELSRGAVTAVVGPSAVPARCLIEAGADVVSGSIVVDPELAKAAVMGGTKDQWRAGIKKFSISSASTPSCM